MLKMDSYHYSALWSVRTENVLTQGSPAEIYVLKSNKLFFNAGF